MPGREPPPLQCEVAAVVVTLRDTPRLRAAIDSVRRSAGGRSLEVVCVLNDPGSHGWWAADGVHWVGAGMNLGWAAGLHAGLLGVESRYVWAIQDDLTVGPQALTHLCTALESDERLGSARPLSVDERGMVGEGTCGGRVADDGRWSGPIPSRSTPAARLERVPVGDYLPSSGQLIRRAAWDAVGGFDPWFYPWGYIDIDFGRTLRECGWRFATEPSARMQHATRGSTTTLFRWLCSARNQALFAGKWSDASEGLPPPKVAPSPAITAAARAARGTPRDLDLSELQRIAGIAAADLGLSAMRWSSADALLRAARLAVRDPGTRRDLRDKATRAARRATRG